MMMHNIINFTPDSDSPQLFGSQLYSFIKNDIW